MSARRATLISGARPLADELANYRHYSLLAQDPFKLERNGLNAVALSCQVMVDREPWVYNVWLVQKTAAPRTSL